MPILGPSAKTTWNVVGPGGAEATPPGVGVLTFAVGGAVGVAGVAVGGAEGAMDGAELGMEVAATEEAGAVGEPGATGLPVEQPPMAVPNESDRRTDIDVCFIMRQILGATGLDEQ